MSTLDDHFKAVLPEDAKENEYANIYDPESYEKIVEEFTPRDEDIQIVQQDLWGKFEPTFYQYEWFEHFNQRDENGYLQKLLEAIAIVHRRAGKSTGIFKTVLLPWMLERRGTYVHVFPSLTQGRAAIWNGMGQITRDPDEQAIPYLELIPKELWKKKNNHDMSLELYNGSVYRIVGSIGKDGTAGHLRGLNAIGVIADEFPEYHKDVISEIFGPMIGQNGGFIFKIGTPKGENHAYRDYLFLKQKQVVDPKLKAWLYDVDHTNYNDGTRVVSDEYIQRELERGVEPEIIRQEYYCDFKGSSSGAIYKHQMRQADEELRITSVPHDVSYPVFAFYDIGTNNNHAAWTVQCPNERTINLIGFKSESEADSSLYQFVEKIKNLGYPIKRHYFPWDGNSPESTGVSKVEFVVQKGVLQTNEYEVIQRSAKKAIGIEYLKAIFNKIWIDEKNCHAGVIDLRHYSKPKNQTTDNFGVGDIHNKHSHGADAARTMACAYTLGQVPIGKADDMYKLDSEMYEAKFTDMEI